MVSNAIVINSNPILDQEWILRKIAHFHCNNKFEDFGWNQIREVVSAINAALPKESWFKCLFEDRLDKLGFSISETIPHALGKDFLHLDGMISQCPRTNLNKRFLPRPKNITA